LSRSVAGGLLETSRLLVVMEGRALPRSRLSLDPYPGQAVSEQADPLGQEALGTLTARWQGLLGNKEPLPPPFEPGKALQRGVCLPVTVAGRSTLRPRGGSLHDHRLS